jgi:hypothetical protein
MNLTENQTNNLYFYNELLSQSWKDELFKKNLVSNPVQTIESFIGKPIYLENGKKRIVVEDQGNSNIIYLNIPAQPNSEDLELTEAQLETVAGGSSPYCLYGACLLVGFAIGLYNETHSK